MQNQDIPQSPETDKFEGVKCMVRRCPRQAAHKIAETDVQGHQHELTSYLCEQHFHLVMDREEYYGDLSQYVPPKPIPMNLCAYIFHYPDTRIVELTSDPNVKSGGIFMKVIDANFESFESALKIMHSIKFKNLVEYCVQEQVKDIFKDNGSAYE
jgi:hypothetical protein